MKKISAILITIIFLATITMGKSYYDDKIKADVQKAHSSSQVEDKKQQKKSMRLKKKFQNEYLLR